MFKNVFFAGVILIAAGPWSASAEDAAPAVPAPPVEPGPEACREAFTPELDAAVCAKFKVSPKCKSLEGETIPFYEKEGKSKTLKRILVFGQIHGDEADAGKLAARWIKRLDRIDPSNTWRILPRLNPDGFRLKTRANARGVDLNRNFPTTAWDQWALREWEKKYKKNPRRYPGAAGGSEPETQCAVESIADFRPDIVVSIHTPYGLLDFDGPKIRFPKFSSLPWHLLGQFPGSLGHYMWIDRGVPVLTVELSPSSLRTHLGEFERLQDLVSLLVPDRADPAF
jgi:hypothetical protein